MLINNKNLCKTRMIWGFNPTTPQEKRKSERKGKGVVWRRERDRRAAAESEQKTSERVKQL